jgi:hypothetical protein
MFCIGVHFGFRIGTKIINFSDRLIVIVVQQKSFFHSQWFLVWRLFTLRGFWQEDFLQKDRKRFLARSFFSHWLLRRSFYNQWFLARINMGRRYFSQWLLRRRFYWFFFFFRIQSRARNIECNCFGMETLMMYNEN